MPGLPRAYIFLGRPGARDRLVTAINAAFIYLRSSLVKGGPVYEYDLEDYAAQLVALLPRGAAWDTVYEGVFGDLIYAIAEEFKRVSDKMAELESETFPLNTTQLLTDWERVLGLPDPCSAGAKQSTPERRAAVATKLSTVSEPTPSFFSLLAADFGYAIEVIEYFPARVGRARVGDAINAAGNEFNWAVKIPSTYTQSRRAVVGDTLIGDRIATSGDGSLECLISQFKPAHTVLKFLREGEEGVPENPTNDILATTYVTGITATAYLDGVLARVRFRCDPIMDPTVVGRVTSGAKEIVVYANDVQIGVIPVTPGPAVRFQNVSIGSPVAAGSLTQSGTDYTLVGGGTGVGGTTDVCELMRVSGTGNFLIIATLYNLIGAVAGQSAFGIMVRPTGDIANDRCVMAILSTLGVRARRRENVGDATIASTRIDAVDGGVWPLPVAIEGIAGAINVKAFIDGEWVLLGGPFTTAVGSSIDLCGFASINQPGGGTVTAEFRNVMVRFGEIVYPEFIDTSPGYSTLRTYTAKGRDIAGNTSVISPTSAAVTTPAMPAPAIVPKLVIDNEAGTILPGIVSGNSPTISTEQKRAGLRALKSILTRATSPNKFRTELHYSAEDAAGKFPIHSEFWLSGSIYLPAGYNTPESTAWEVLAQLHATEDPDDEFLNPPFSINFEQGQFIVRSIGDARTGAALVKPYQDSNNSARFDAVVGGWNDFVIRGRHDWTPGQAILQVWHNGTQRVNVTPETNPTGQFGFNDGQGMYLKYGMYKGDWKTTTFVDPVATRTVFHDCWRVWFEAISYEEADPVTLYGPRPV